MGETRVDLQHLLEDLRDAYSGALEQSHVALSVALALAPLAVEAAGEHAFTTQFLAHWGGGPARASTAGSRGRRLA